MELTVAKKDLLKIVARMQGVAERKSTMPVLANVLLAVDGPNALRLAATDLYLSLLGRVNADVAKPGSVAVSAKDLFERIKMMPDGPVVITTQDNATTTLKASGSARRYTLRGMPGDDFPPLPQPAEGSPTLALAVDVLAELIAKTHFSISTDETRAHLNSALFEWDGDIVRMVTTDGHRLSKVDVKVSGRQASATMLIPLKAIQELRRLCDEMMAEPHGDGEKRTPELLITQSGSSAFFQGAGMTFSVKLVDAQFPPYSQVIPAASDKIVRAPRTAFADALKAVSVAASERTGGVKLSLTNGSMRITSESPESGDGFDEIPVEYAGPNMSIGFNAKYFLDVLASVSDDEVSLSLSGELDPAVLRPAGATTSSDRQFLAVIMPMRI
ncbi:DNA polymerase III beta subunit [Labilithrix luteola]|uniref:Beta sliding clamp n=1 Tax=Labilithrix luteola TaxID=1391654 RepID=A0A0K1PTU4_9BACT|nr:DNA polymerase III subunit beta [Labilithrix luteola]AKU96781.1 DNA polymerase III beta subunit [Labilithrix luteola]